MKTKMLFSILLCTSATMWLPNASAALDISSSVISKGYMVADTGVKVMGDGIYNAGNKIMNLGKGVVDTDAVNLGQLKELVGAANNQSMNIQPLLQNNENRIRKYANAGTASSMAAVNIPQAYVPGHNSVGMGLGYAHGQSAMAVGLSRITDGGDWIFKGSASINSKGGVFGAGAAYTW